MFRMGTTYFGVSINFLVHVSLLWIRFLNSHMQTQTTISILLYAIKAKNPPLSLRRTCCRQSPSPLNHNLWLVLWGRTEKCNQVQNANASLWGDRHLISKQPLKAPYGISCLYEARRNRKTQQRAHAVCSFCLRARGSSWAFRAENELWGWDVQHAWVLVHFIIVILTKKLAAWSIWRGQIPRRRNPVTRTSVHWDRCRNNLQTWGSGSGTFPRLYEILSKWMENIYSASNIPLQTQISPAYLHIHIITED